MRMGVLAIVALAVVALAAAFLVRGEGSDPTIRLDGVSEGALGVGVAGLDATLLASDEGSGLRSIEAVLVGPGGETVLASETLPGSLVTGGADPSVALSLALRIDPKAARVPEGDAVLRLRARDWSWRGGLGGNETVVEIPLLVDLTPPRVSVENGLTYVTVGGAGAVTWFVSEPVVRDGVEVGDSFYPGFPLPGGRRGAVFAVPSEGPADPHIRVLAVDTAGNESGGAWPVVVKPRAFSVADVNLPASFLERVVPRLAASEGVSESDPVEAFRVINTRTRGENEARIRELLLDSSERPLWKGAFLQLPNSKVTSRFAERRTYVVAGTANSKATHYGFDLASTAAAPIIAANTGRVAYAGPLGIYGNCVLVDHGFGVATLYGHLSRLDVNAGDAVERGQTLGRSGASGLAGGDHLHFAVLVGGTYVDPVEWWDAKWVQTHIDARLVTPAP